MLILGNISIAGVNYLHYGVFIRNDIREGSFPEAYAALTRIKSDSTIRYVPVNKEARTKAYAVSPTFAELREYIDGSQRNVVYVPGTDSTEIIGGFMIWVLKRGAAQCGHYTNLEESQRFFRQIADEINLAFEQGKLEERTNFSFSGFSLEKEHLEPVLKMFMHTTVYTTGFREYSPYPVFHQADTEGILHFQNIANETAIFHPRMYDDYKIPDKLKFVLLIAVSAVYEWINPVTAIISVLLFIVISILLVFNKVNRKLFELWFVSLVFLLLAVIRMFLISYMEAMQWPGALIPQYLSVAYPFMLIFEVVILYSMLMLFKSDNRRYELISKAA